MSYLYTVNFPPQIYMLNSHKSTSNFKGLFWDYVRERLWQNKKKPGADFIQFKEV